MATTHADHGTEAPRARTERTHGIGEVVKLVVPAVVLVALVLFAALNADEVSVDYLVGDAAVPLIVVILGSAVAGALVASLARRRRS